MAYSPLQHITIAFIPNNIVRLGGPRWAKKPVVDAGYQRRTGLQVRRFSPEPVIEIGVPETACLHGS